MHWWQLSHRTRSSGPALRCSLFWIVCLISCFSSWGMSPRCAMSRMRVSGVDAVYASVKDGSLHAACRESSAVTIAVL